MGVLLGVKWYGGKKMEDLHERDYNLYLPTESGPSKHFVE